jgi:TatD DNase family protein
MTLIDSHAHFDDARFDDDREAAWARARAAGVVEQVVPAVSAATWPRLKRVVAEHAGLHAAYGLHPMFLAEHRPEHLEALGHWLERERPVAVGECGLDFYVEGLDRTAQTRYFTAQLALAAEFELPVVIHARRAVDEVTKHIRRQPGLRGVVHSFSGSEQQACKLIDLGFCLGLGGPLTYPRANRLRRVAARVPLEGLLLETDAPDQPGNTHRGERNEPAYLPEVLATLAELRGRDPAEIAAATTANARRVFALAP